MASEVSREEVLDLVRDRRAHYEKIYLQCEKRAQVVSGLVVAVGAALLSLFAARLKAGELGTLGSFWLWLVMVCASVMLVWTLLLSLCTAYPPAGRHLDGFPFGGLLTRARGWVWRHRKAALKKRLADTEGAPDEKSDAFRDHLESVLGFERRHPDAEGIVLFARSILFPQAPRDAFDVDADPLLRAELYNTWAQWWVYEWRAGVLRQTIREFMFALFWSLMVFVSIKVA